MKEHTRRLLLKARRAIDSAGRLVADGDLDFAASRSYYAMFYAATGLLNEELVITRKHSGVHSMFAELYIRTGKMNPKYHKWLLQAFAARLESDYDVEIAFAVERVELMIGRSREFVDAVEQILGSVRDKMPRVE